MIVQIPLTKTRTSLKEKENVIRALECGNLSGDGPFTLECHKELEKITNAKNVLLAHSCTAALEMTALLLDLQPGDEVIMPSYTFVSTALSVVLRGAVPVFIDIKEDDFNMNEELIESAITEHTKAIYVVHYAGVSCNMDYIISLSHKYNLKVVEDAAQGIGAEYKGKHLGTIGELGTLSFHATKNIQSGEGGALLINDQNYLNPAEIIRDKGTNRKVFLRNEVDKYTWVGIGSSYLPSDLVAACLLAQLEDLKIVTQTRLSLWDRYHNLLSIFERNSVLRRPIIPSYAQHNAHIYSILLPNFNVREKLISKFRDNEIQATFHYVPLHSSPAGKRYGRIASSMGVTDKVAGCLLRLPLYPDLEHLQQDRILGVLGDFFNISKTTVGVPSRELEVSYES